MQKSFFSPQTPTDDNSLVTLPDAYDGTGLSGVTLTNRSLVTNAAPNARAGRVNPDGTYTVAGWTWNPSNAVTDGSVISGGADISTFPSAFLESLGQPLAEQTVGNILFGQPNYSVTLDSSDRTKSEIELTWGGQGLPNRIGNDFVVYENGNINAPEAYAVAVRLAGSDTFTNYRYKFYDTFESEVTANPSGGVLATAFNLDDFGIAPGQSIDAIRIINLLPRDRVGTSGEGFLGTSDTRPLDPSTSQPFARADLDPDITFVAGLQQLIPQSAFDVRAVGVGDFNGDGNADIIFRNRGTGQNFLWLLDGTNLQSVVDLPSFPDPNWNIQSTGDFNGDEETDIVWRNQTTGENIVWFLSGTEFVGTAELDPEPNLNVDIGGTGDFNGDGQTDILWRDQVTGDNFVLLENGTTGFLYNFIFPLNDVNWFFRGTGDFNGDGQPDIVLRNQNTGENVVWLMDGIYLSENVFINEWNDLNWNITGTGDFNSDGQTDILWQNAVTDELVVWLMSGTEVEQVSSIVS